MNPIYQVFAEGPDGTLYMVRGRVTGGGAGWFEDIEEARRAAAGAAIIGNASKFWLVETRPLEELKPGDGPKAKKPGPPPSADLHIFHSLHAERDVPGEHSTFGEECSDQFDGMIHLRPEADRIVELLRGMGFQVKMDRIVRSNIYQDPDFVGKNDGD